MAREEIFYKGNIFNLYPDKQVYTKILQQFY